MISDETFVENSRLFETAINCHYFIVDVEYSALIVHKMLVNLKTIDRKLYDAIQENLRGDLLTILFAAGELFGLALPIARVLVRHENGGQLWGTLIKIYEGDFDTRLKRPDNGSRLDIWSKPAREHTPAEANEIKAAAEKKSHLREIANDKYSLLSVSAKMISPVVYLHNFFSLGHFDIKPSNMVFKKNRSIEVVAIDFGLIAPLGQRGPLRGTVAFTAPEVECAKEPPSPTQSIAVPQEGGIVSKLPYLASYDVYALGLTLGVAWTMSLSHTRRFVWTERCIRPLLLQGVSLDFVDIRRQWGPQVFTQEIRKSLNRCVEPGGKMEKLYLPNMPFLIKTKIRQMIETNPVIRISASNAFAFVAVARALEAVRERPVEEAQQLLRQAQGTVLLRLSLSKAGTRSIEVGTARGRQQATETLRALLELATWSPIREAVASCVVPIPVATIMRLTTLPKAVEVAEAQEKLPRLLHWPLLQQQEGQMKDKSYAELIDAVFGVDMEGLNVITQQQIIDRKMSAANLLISRSVHLYIERQLLIDPYIQLVEETPSESTIAFILKSVGIADGRDSDILAYFKDRVFTSYVAWASADRLIRLAVRRCVSRDPAGASIHAKYSAGEVVAAVEKQLLHHCVWQQVTQISSETHYGPPWGVSAALFDFGAPEEQVSVHLRDVVTPIHMEAAWRTEDALSLLHLQVDRAVSRLCIVAAGVAATTAASAAATAAAALPENSNLRDIYTKIMTEMQRDNYVPFAFGNHQERPEYTETMFNLSVLNFKRAVVFTAAKRQLGIVASETLKSMRKSRRSAATVDSVLSDVPESILAWGRYATEEAIAKNVIREVVEKEIKIANTPKSKHRRKRSSNA
ncbi:protein kinase, putative [Eimeria necatrix]|uniref:Protein kinase, putative n=1 Tax=Eimeria necatrix TaxID=51315 RepID=U6MKD2_9EIME|nr:protein kinase, putative [Eimeria necatrix]CDJ62095.1 protein kinase, putative [Eimeria necatrix]